MMVGWIGLPDGAMGAPATVRLVPPGGTRMGGRVPACGCGLAG